MTANLTRERSKNTYRLINIWENEKHFQITTIMEQNILTRS